MYVRIIMRCNDDVACCWVTVEAALGLTFDVVRTSLYRLQTGSK